MTATPPTQQAVVTCPCCHGEKVMKVYEPTASFERMHTFTIVPCCHCEGTGTVPAEVEELPHVDWGRDVTDQR